MLQAAVAYYERCFDQLHCAKHPILGEAPHKPILLLALMQMVETGTLKSKQIGLTPLLQQTFEHVWYQYVRTQHKMNLAQPFYHMQYEPFWNIQRKTTSNDDFYNKNKMKSLYSLQQQVDYATIDDELWACWQDKNSRENLAAFLIMRYFNKTQPQPKDNAPSKGATILSIHNHMMPSIIWGHDWVGAMVACRGTQCRLDS